MFPRVFGCLCLLLCEVCDSSCCSFSGQWGWVWASPFTVVHCFSIRTASKEAGSVCSCCSAVSALFWACLEYWNQICSSWNSVLLAKGIVVEWYLKWGCLGCHLLLQVVGRMKNLVRIKTAWKTTFQYAGSEQRTASTFTLSKADLPSPGVTSLRQRSLCRWGWCNWILSQGFKSFLL